jgi:hypothetical protein
VDGSGHAAGDETISGQGTEAQGAVAVNGSAHTDTAQCAKYPVSGTVTVHVGSETKTITFNNKCDGSFGYSAPGLNYLSYEFCWQSCSYGVTELFRNFIVEDGQMSLDPACAVDRTRERYTITYSGPDISIAHHYVAGGYCFDAFDGTLVLHNLAGHPETFLGTDSYTATYTCPSNPSSNCSKSHSDQTSAFLVPTKQYCNY